MEEQKSLFIPKGFSMEEKLRSYFLDLGYYVVRGINYKYENTTITDIDIFLYGRFSSISRQRINVDIKNKKSAQAYERILWATGLKELLGFDSCIIATSDKRAALKNFAELHSTTLMDGNFLAKLSKTKNERLLEEEFVEGLSGIKSFKTFRNTNWLGIYEKSKSSLLTEMDYSGFNYNLNTLKYFLTKIISDSQNAEKAIRLSYMVISYLLIILDYINKDIAFLEQDKRAKIISDGLKFGNLGRDGINRTIMMAQKIAGTHKNTNTVKALFDEIPSDVLTSFFVKNENSKKLFLNAKEFEKVAFSRTMVKPDSLENNLKSIFAVFLDYFGFQRNQYLNTALNPITPKS